MRPYLKYLLGNGAVEHVKAKWGKSQCYAIIIEGKKCPYKVGDGLIKT